MKEEFLFKDRLIKGIEEHGQFKISIVKTTEVVKTAQKNHSLSLLNTVLLGRTLTAAMLLASELKGEERVKIRLEGNGPVGMIVAEANRAGEIRGYVQKPSASLDYSRPGINLGDGIGIGILTVSKTLYDEAEPRTSTIQIVEGDILSDMAHFMAQSEQVLSAFLLDVEINKNGEVEQAGGLLIQRLPDADESVMNNLQKKLAGYSTISANLQKGVYIDKIMHQVAEPYTVKELDRQPVHFFCRCNPERFINALSMLNYEDLKELKDDKQEIVCHYCGNRLSVPKKQMQNIFEEARAKLN